MKRRRNTWIKRCLLSFLVLFALLTIVFAGSWYSTRNAGEKQLAIAMQELESREPGWRTFIETRNQTLAPPDQNSALLAFEIHKSLPLEFHQQCNLIEMPSAEVHSNHLDPDDWIATLRMKLQPHRETIESLKLFIDTKPNSGFPIELNYDNPYETILPGRQEMRRIIQLLMFECRLQLADNHPDEAVRCCRAILGISRAIGDEPFLISQLLRQSLIATSIINAEKILGCGNPTMGLIELQEEFTAQLQTNHMLTGLKGERESLDLLYQSLDTGRTNLEELASNRPAQKNLFSIEYMVFENNRKLIPGLRADQIFIFDKMFAASLTSFPQRYDRFKLIEYDLRNRGGFNQFLLRILIPVLQKTDDTEFRIKSRLQCAICGIACERFRQIHKRWPHSLDEIPKDLLPSVPLSLVDGEPLKLHRTSTGLVITDLDEDNFDDILEREHNGTFTGFRLFDPQLRRQVLKASPPPPLPKENDRN
ncbi:MAG: hypothetical protein U0798_08285 [Gemmataceae bacterium]